MICRAARSALIDRPGIALPRANHAYSWPLRPLNSAFRWLPVRMRPGQTVVTTIPYRASSARRPSDSPAAANLLATYGQHVRDGDLRRRST